MKHPQKIFSLIVALTMTALMLTSCGSKDSTDTSQAAPNASVADENNMGNFGWSSEDAGYGMMVPEEPVAPEYAENEVAGEVDMPNTSAEVPNAQENSSEEKIIKNGSLMVETLEFDKFVSDLEASVSTFNGYIESSSVYGFTNYRTASYTVRIPYQKYDEFVNTVGNLGTVTSSDESIENVTLQYVDIEARLAALRSERDSFMELMDKAETIEEILQIQSYLTDVNYQIESYTSQLKTLNNKVSYSTVTITVDEVARITPEAPKTVWERIRTGFSESIYNVGEGLKSLFVTVVVSLPYIGILAAVIAVIVIIIVIILKASHRSQQKKLEAYKRNNSDGRRSDDNSPQNKEK